MAAVTAMCFAHPSRRDGTAPIFSNMFQVTRKQFRKLVASAMEAMPADILARIDNLEIVIKDAPSPVDYRENDVLEEEELFGLFDGIPLTERALGDELTAPNVITIFQQPHEQACDTLDELESETARTLRHEVAHHFGISDDRLDELGAY